MRESGLAWLWQTATLSLPRRLRRARVGRRGAALLAVAILLAGCVATACAAGLPDRAAGDVGFGLGIFVLLAGAALLWIGLRRRAALEINTAAALVLLSAWTVGATAWTLPAQAARWISFGDGLGYLALSLGVLVHYALSDERLVLVLEVREPRPR